MKYIKKIVLENFQSHKYTEFEFDQFLNVILGPSDSGKSAIIRAIKWVAFNEPSGDYFVTEGENECHVTLILSDNVSIKRSRIKNKNIYLVIDKYGREERYEGFGLKIPEDVVEKMEIRKILLDHNVSNSINIAEQLEGPFLLSESNSTKANAIGRLVGVNILDKSLKSTLLDIKHYKGDINKNNIIITNKSEELKKYDYLDNLLKTIKKLEIYEKTIRVKEEKLQRLEEIYLKLNGLNLSINNHATIIKELNSLENLEQLKKELGSLLQKYNFLISIDNRLKLVKEKINRDIKLADKLKNLEKFEDNYKTLKEEIKLLFAYIHIFEDLNKIEKERNTLTTLLDKLHYNDDIKANIHLIQDKFDKLEKYIEIFKNYRSLTSNIKKGYMYIENFKNLNEVTESQNLILNKTRKLSNLLEINNKLKVNDSDILETIDEIKSLNKKLAFLKDEYYKMLKKLEICPLCFSTIDDKKIENILEKLN